MVYLCNGKILQIYIRIYISIQIGGTYTFVVNDIFWRLSDKAM